MNERIKNKHAVILGRRGGKVGGAKSTPAKRKAARQNGKLGGRPKFGKAKRRNRNQY
jgi:hypothetical protein